MQAYGCLRWNRFIRFYNRNRNFRLTRRYWLRCWDWWWCSSNRTSNFRSTQSWSGCNGKFPRPYFCRLSYKDVVGVCVGLASVGAGVMFVTTVGFTVASVFICLERPWYMCKSWSSKLSFWSSGNKESMICYMSWSKRASVASCGGDVNRCSVSRLWNKCSGTNIFCTCFIWTACQVNQQQGVQRVRQALVKSLLFD